VSDIGAEQRADSGGVDRRNGGAIDDQRVGILGANRGLKLDQRSEHDGTLEAENSLAGLGTFAIVVVRGSCDGGGMREILAASAIGNVRGM